MQAGILWTLQGWFDNRGEYERQVGEVISRLEKIHGTIAKGKTQGNGDLPTISFTAETPLGMGETAAHDLLREIVQRTKFVPAAAVQISCGGREIPLFAPPDPPKTRRLFRISWPVQGLHRRSANYVVSRAKFHIMGLETKAELTALQDWVVAAQQDGRSIWCTGVSKPVTLGELRETLEAIASVVISVGKAERMMVPVEPTAAIMISDSLETSVVGTPNKAGT